MYHILLYFLPKLSPGGFSNRNNKTGLQPVSKPVEQELGFFKGGWHVIGLRLEANQK